MGFKNLDDKKNHGNYENLSSETHLLRPVDAQHGPHQIPQGPPKKRISLKKFIS